MEKDDFSPFVPLGGLSLVGAATCLFLAFSLPISVETSYLAQDVVNLAMLQRQTMLFTAGCALTVNAFVCFGFSSVIGLLKKPAAESPPRAD